MKKELRTSFVNRVMGLSFSSTQGKYSYCNDQSKQVLFSLDSSNGEGSDLILSPKWKKNGYAHSLKHIDKILNHGYELLIFKTKTRKNNNDETVADGFEPLLEKRTLVVDGDEFRAVPIEILASEEVCESSGPYYEGAIRKITVNAYERDSAARQKCLDEYGYKCLICNFNFEEKYGERGKDFIHVHHIVPLSEIKKGYEVKPLDDLIPVCANCHAMLHRSGTILPEELKAMIKNS
jgi:5-methylcytosine-specific restriction protein A